PASTVGAVILLAILKVLFGVPLVGALVTWPPAGPPKVTQYVSPPLIVKRMPPSVPGAGGSTVMCGCGPGPRKPLTTIFTTKVPLPDFLISAVFTGPTRPSGSL